MRYRCALGALTLAAAVGLSLGGARAFDEGNYPSWKGQWLAADGNQDAGWDLGRPPGLAQQPPLTDEYRAIYEASLKDRAAGGHGADPSYRCIPAGMPRVMNAAQPMEIVIHPEATYIMLELFSTIRRIFTDGRAFPNDIEPNYAGYSIGQWHDTDGDGRFDTLTVETRAIKGPHTYDASGTPFHKDGEAVVTETISSDRSDPNLLRDRITTTDHALTGPWTVTRSYRRDRTRSFADWSEHVCREDSRHIQIGGETYEVGTDGLLMPARKGQKPPDLKYFK